MELVKANNHIEINRKFGVEEFGALLEQAMVREPKWTQKKSFAPSGLGYAGSCPRYWHYAFNGENFVYTNDGPSMANMNAGTDAGARIANLLDKAGLLVEAEAIAKYDDPPIFGYIDAIINWKGQEVLVEVKTTKNSTWNARSLKNEVPNYQMIQLLIYMYVTNHDRGFFLTENKDSHQIFIVPVKMTDERRAYVERVFDWMRKVKDNADNGPLPERPFNRSSMQCKGCAVRDACWDGWVRGSVNGADPNPGEINITPLELS